jgi:hypothetical protein
MPPTTTKKSKKDGHKPTIAFIFSSLLIFSFNFGPSSGLIAHHIEIVIIKHIKDKIPGMTPARNRLLTDCSVKIAYITKT